MPYIGRSGWNTLTFGGAIPDDEILEAIDTSYDTIVSKLPKSAGRPRCETRLALLARHGRLAAAWRGVFLRSGVVITESTVEQTVSPVPLAQPD